MKKLLFIGITLAVFASCQKTETVTAERELAPLKMEEDGLLHMDIMARKPASPPGKNKPKPPQDTIIVTPPDTTTDPPAPTTGYITVLIDWDGHNYTGAFWTQGFSEPANLAELDTNYIMAGIRAAYSRWNVRFTTSELEYSQANPYRRQRIVMAGNDLYGVQGGSGVAYVGTATYGPEAGQIESPPAFVYPGNMQNYDLYVMLIAVHEIGHTLWLVHMNLYNADCTINQRYLAPYYMGNPTYGGDPLWAPGHPCRFQNGAYNKSDDQVLTEICGRR